MFEQLPSSIAWRVIGLQSSARNTVFAGLKERNLQLAEFLLHVIWVSKLACFADIVCHLNKLNTGILHNYRCTEKQDRCIQKEAGSLG